ncbi:DNA recombination protein RmuC [Dehalococcoidia bacterium]|nr:DNA recombination protein RmuC [Dehalococcoidia bacterium]
MDTIIVTALGILIALVIALLVVVWRASAGRPSNVSERIDASLKGIEEAKNVISDHALKTVSEIKDIGHTVYKLVQQQEEAEKLGQSLKDLLQAPKLRGSYGEAILEEMLDRVLPRGIWERQFVINGKEVVDCVVRFKDVVVPIDAKFPRDAYIRYLEVSSPSDKARYWKDFERAIKAKVTSIESKYVKPEMGTSEFALMFIPSEAIYYETIAERNQLGEPSSILEFAQKHHVLPVSPNTFYAFLQIVALGIRNVEIIRNARELQQGLSSLQRNFRLFSERFEQVGKNIETASEAYRIGRGHIERYQRTLYHTLQLETLHEEIEQDLNDVPNKG